jgi:hypothetical protein
MTNKIEKTRAVAVGKYAILLERCQLTYFTNGEIIKVNDVRPEFSTTDLMDLATRISEKNELPKPFYIKESEARTHK